MAVQSRTGFACIPEASYSKLRILSVVKASSSAWRDAEVLYEDVMHISIIYCLSRIQRRHLRLGAKCAVERNLA
jgi:hypothetical protein